MSCQNKRKEKRKKESPLYNNIKEKYFGVK